MAFQFPNNPTIGQSVLNPTSSQYYTWNGTAWTQYPTSASYAISSSYSVTSSFALNGGGAGGTTISISDNAPTGSAANSGSLWFNSNNLGLYVRYDDGDSTQWVAASAVGPVATASIAFSSSFAQTALTSSFAQTASLARTASFATNIRQLNPTEFVSYTIESNYGESNLALAGGGAWTELTGTSTTFIIPTGFSSNKVVYSFVTWGDVNGTNAVGSLRYRLRFTAGGAATIPTITMGGWALVGTTVQTRYNVAGQYVQTGLTPGTTYTVVVDVSREGEAGTITNINSWARSLQATILVK